MARLAVLGAVLGMLHIGLNAAPGVPEDSLPPLPHNCPAAECVCAADLLSCAGRGLQDVPAELPATVVDLDLSHNALRRLHPGWLAPLSRLRALRLSYNELEVLGRGAFTNASGLQLLDLSSNALRALGRHDLDGLGALERLLLFNNRLAHLDEHAFHGLGALRQLYLGCNELAAFSFDGLHSLSAARLRTLDLSSNQLRRLPVPQLAALPDFLKNGLYLHNNPLPCDCRLYHLLRRWHQRGLSAVREFALEYVCLAFKVPASRVRFFQHSRVFENCSTAAAQDLEQPEGQLAVQAGHSLQLRCNTSAPATRVAWVSPEHELLLPPGSRDGSIQVLADGSLTISEVRRQQHQGIFVCLATGPHLHEQTHEYNVSVHRAGPEAKGFNTSYTTLLGCIVALVLVLLYLFAPPCRGCRPRRRGARTPSPLQELSAQSSVLSTTPPEVLSRKASAHKHVVFLEPGRRGLNGRVQLAVAEDFSLYNPGGLQLKVSSGSASSTASEGAVVT